MTRLSPAVADRLLPSEPPAPIDLERELATGFAGRYIRRKAHQLVGKAGYTRSDRPDIEQELSLALYERLLRFDPTIAPWPAFVVTVVTRFAASLLAARRTKKRLPGYLAASLNSHAIGQDGRRADLARHVEPRNVSAVTGHYSQDAFVLALLRCDLAVVTKRLPLKLKHLCFRLQHESVTEVSRRMGCSRTALYRRIAQLRRVFLDAGLRDFLEDRRTLRP